MEFRDGSIRLPCPAPHQRGWRVVVHGGRERDGDDLHGERPVVRQDARVQGGGTRDGTTYNERAGLWSPTATATTAACSPLPPRFRADSYSFEISALASVGDAVGAVSAFDVNDDTVSYSITAGNDDSKFAIASSIGEVTVAASLSGAGDTRTLTVGAGDGVSGTTSVTVTIRLTATCSDGIAVSDAANNPGLVSDCETLLVARDTLAGARC